MADHLVCWVDIPVVDLKRAVAFYAAILGQPVKIETAGPGQEFGLLPHAGDSVSGCLAVMRGRTPSQDGPLVYLSVNGRLDAALDAARAGGGRIIQEKHPIGPYGFRALIADTEGNAIALHSQKA
ncbi:MAG TPA: VOC family protein [Phycisphaerae bacterium]|nr:VOC family protein [Phycisphaerae bacterium]